MSRREVVLSSAGFLGRLKRITRGQLIGAYTGAGLDGLKSLGNFERLLGRQTDAAIDFVDYADWKSFESSSEWIAKGWDGSGKQLVLSVPLSVESSPSLRAVAGGYHDASFLKLGRVLSAHGFGNAILRLGWEQNGSWMPWSSVDGGSEYIACFRRVASLLKSVSQGFQFHWCPNKGNSDVSPVVSFPGTDFVDYVGLDVYNEWWLQGDEHDPELRYLRETFGKVGSPWAKRAEGGFIPWGLAWLSSFASDIRKPIIIGEWGTGFRADGHGGGDDGLFIRRVGEWIKGSDVYCHFYWDYPAADYHARISLSSNITGVLPSDPRDEKPNAAEAFRKIFAEL